jgi:hypothetical protein
MNEPEPSAQGSKGFAYTHKNVKGESWMKTKDGFSVRFISDDIRTRCSMIKKGTGRDRKSL